MEISGHHVCVNSIYEHTNCGNLDVSDRAAVIPSTRQGAVSERSLYKAAVCLGLLCVLLLAGVTALGVIYANINTERIMDTVERDQLQTSNTILTRERDQLQTSNTNLTRERDDLKRRLSEVTFCPAGWLKFGCSCYYVSTERKNWADSREECIERGADLVIINSLEEQDFLNNLKKRLWIGLYDSVTEDNFVWVDGTTLTTPKYWMPDHPKHYMDMVCGEIYSTFQYTAPPLTWHDSSCNDPKFWVCERGI